MQIARSDAHPLICHLDDDRARSLILPLSKVHHGFFFRVFDGIVYQIVEHIAQHLPIGRKVQIIRLNI